MVDSIEARQLPASLEIRGTNTLLERVREGLGNDSALFVAGEVSRYDGYKWDQHNIFVAPITPSFDAESLTNTANRIAANIPPSFMREAHQYEDWNLQLPDLHYDEEVGKVTTRITTTMTIVMPTPAIEGVAPGRTKETEKEEHPLMQRTNVKVYPDTHTAHLLYTTSLGRLEETVKGLPHDLVTIYHTHQLTPEVLELLKKHYEDMSQQFQLEGALT